MALPSGLQPSATRWGVAIGLYATDPAYRLEIERAPDNGSGQPVLSGAEAVAEVPGADIIIIDDLPSDGLRRHYRYRQVREGEMPSEWTCWVSSPPYPLSSTPERPAVVLPVVRESISVAAEQRTVTLTVEDPQCRVAEVAFDVGSGFTETTEIGGAYTSPAVAASTRIRARVRGYDASGVLVILLERDFGTEGTTLPGTGPQPGTFVAASPRWDRSLGSEGLVYLDLVIGTDTRSIRIQYQYAKLGSLPDTAVDYVDDLPEGFWSLSRALEDEAGNIRIWPAGSILPRITLTPHSGTGGTGITGASVIVAPQEGGVGVRVRERGGVDGPVIQADYLGVGPGLSLSLSPDGRPVVAVGPLSDQYLPLAGGTVGPLTVQGSLTAATLIDTTGFDLAHVRVSDLPPSGNAPDGTLWAYTGAPSGGGGGQLSVEGSSGGPRTVSLLRFPDVSIGGAGAEATISFDGRYRLLSAMVPWGQISGVPAFAPAAHSLESHTGELAWGRVSKSGSSLADLATRSASHLNSGTLSNARLPQTISISGSLTAATLIDTTGFDLAHVRVSDLPPSGNAPDGTLWAYTGAPSGGGGGQLSVEGSSGGPRTVSLLRFPDVSIGGAGAEATISFDGRYRLLSAMVPWGEISGVPSTFAPSSHTMDSHSGNLPWARVASPPVYATRWPTATEAGALSIGGGTLSGGLTVNGHLVANAGIDPRTGHVDATDPLSAYPSGFSFHNLGGNVGWPQTTGIAITFNKGVSRSFQLFHRKDVNRLHIRSWHQNNADWTEWDELAVQSWVTSRFTGRPSAIGLVAQTNTSGTVAARIITGTTNQIQVSNGNGVSGNPVLSLPADVSITGRFTAAALEDTTGFNLAHVRVSDLPPSGNAPDGTLWAYTGAPSGGGGGQLSVEGSSGGPRTVSLLRFPDVSIGGAGAEATISFDGRYRLLSAMVPWGQISGVPSTFAPSSHTLDSHTGNLGWSSLSGVPTTFPPSAHALGSHTGTLGWGSVSKAGSSLADLATRSASALSSGTLNNALLPQTISISGSVTINSDTARIYLNTAAANATAGYAFRRDGNNRWFFYMTGTEGSGNAGSNLEIRSYNDAGGTLRTPLSINRASGIATFSEPPIGAQSFPLAHIHVSTQPPSGSAPDGTLWCMV